MEKTDWILLQKIHRLQSMSKAAEEMYISQPAVAYRLRKMEDEYKQVLFLRDNHGIRLTPAGMRLYDYAERVLNLEDQIASDVRGVDTGLSGLVMLGATQAFANYHLCDQLIRFTEVYPNVEIAVELSPTPRLYERFKSGKTPFVFLRGNDFEDMPGGHAVLLEEPLIIVAPEQITMKYLKTHPFILNSAMRNMPIDNMIAEWFRHNLDTPPETAHIRIASDSRIVVQLIKKGYGWSIITRTRLLEEDLLYSQPIYRPNGEPYAFKTQVLFRSELKDQEPYSVYLAHVIDYFATARQR